MGLYTYQHPKTNEIIDVYQKMNDKHIYVKDNIQWVRIFYAPGASTDTKINPFNARDFVEKTGKKRGTVGDLIEASKDLSLTREKQIGKDPLKEKYLKNWSNKRKGRPHPDVSRQKAKEFAESKGFSLEL